jgi:hypothetical protein
MRATTLTLLAAAAACTVFAAPASARDYPYCLQGRQTGYPGECSYQTYAQCMASASGRLASCGVNPRFAFGEQRGRGARRGAPQYQDGYYGDPGWSQQRW